MAVECHPRHRQTPSPAQGCTAACMHPTTAMSSVRAVSMLWGRRASFVSKWSTGASALPVKRISNIASFSSNKLSDDNDADEDDLAQWIPPDRPLVGDKGSSHLYKQTDDDINIEDEELNEEEELRQLELELQLEEERQKQRGTRNNIEEPVDWLQTRRTKQLEGVDIMTPDMGTSKKWQDSDVQVIQHTLLTKDEITSCLTALGAKDICYLPNTPERRMGAATGMLVVTGSTPAQILLLADTLVRQLKRRDLAEMGVVAACLGAEGSDDKFDTWRVVDCSNYIVHILDADTRKYLNLEALWSGKDSSLHVNINDEDEMDEYVAANPVPEGYSPNTHDWSSSISQMERNRWIVPHRPVIARPKGRGRKGRRGRRR